jgi:glycosyltransferase involved in cell wall biosynthesis
MDLEAECLSGFERETEYMGNEKPVNRISPLVSVSITTYQHKNFISQCLDGILMQQTTFPVEIIIGEDESTDGTRDICIGYAEKHPDRIRLFLRNRRASHSFDENGNSVCSYNGRWNRLAARGKYMAFCEGDDFWTDPFKLQKQVDFLEANQDFAICHHNMQVIYEGLSGEPHLSNSPDQKEITTIIDLAKGNYIFTASCVFRNGLIKQAPEWSFKAPVGDYLIHMLNARFGKIRYFREPMGVYRIHRDGAWSTKDHIYHKEKWVELLELMENYFSPEVNGILKKGHADLCMFLLDHFKNQPEKCRYYYDKVAVGNPMFGVNLFNDLAKQKEDLVKQREEYEQRITGLTTSLIYERQEYESKINAIYNSWSYKIGNLIIRPAWLIKKCFSLINSQLNKHDETTSEENP